MDTRPTLPYRLHPSEVEDLTKKEKARLRRERLMQVRRQSREAARKIRVKTEQAMRFQQLDLMHAEREKWRQKLDSEIRKLEQVYDDRLNNMGAAHAAARAERDPRVVEEEKKVLREARATSREAVARKVLQDVQQTQALMAAAPHRRRKFVRIVEDERAKRVSSLRTENVPLVEKHVEPEKPPPAQRLWIGPDWPPDKEKRKLMGQAVPFRDLPAPSPSSDPVALARAERVELAKEKAKLERKERERIEAAERRHKKALEQVRLIEDYKKLMSTLKTLQKEKIARTQAQVKQAAKEALQYSDGETEVEPEREQNEERTSGGENAVPNETEVTEHDDGEVEKRYLALISAGQVPDASRQEEPKEERENRQAICGTNRTYGDLDYLPHREHETSSNSSGSPVVQPRRRPYSRERTMVSSPQKMARLATLGRVQPKSTISGDSSSSSASTSSNSGFGDKPTVYVKGDVLGRYLTRALDRLNLSQLTSTPSTSSMSSSSVQSEPVDHPKTRPVPIVKPQEYAPRDVEKEREDALRRVLKSTRGRLTPAEAAWLAARICEKFQTAPSPSTSSSSSVPSLGIKSSKGILKVSTTTTTSTSTRDSVLKEIDTFLRQLGTVLDDKTRSMMAQVAASPPSTSITTESTQSSSSDVSNGLLTKILEDFSRAARTAANAFGSELSVPHIPSIIEESTRGRSLVDQSSYYSEGEHLLKPEFSSRMTNVNKSRTMSTIKKQTEASLKTQQCERVSEVSSKSSSDSERSELVPEYSTSSGVSYGRQKFLYFPESSTTSFKSRPEKSRLLVPDYSSIEDVQKNGSVIPPVFHASNRSSPSRSLLVEQSTSVEGGQKRAEPPVFDIKVTSTPKAVRTGSSQVVQGKMSSASDSEQATPVTAIRALPFDTSLSTIRTKSIKSSSSSSPDSPE